MAPTGCQTGSAGQLSVPALWYPLILGIYATWAGTPLFGGIPGLRIVVMAIREGLRETNHLLSTKERDNYRPNGYVGPMFHVKHPTSLDLGMVGRPG
jgi:hypothetical protein